MSKEIDELVIEIFNKLNLHESYNSAGYGVKQATQAIAQIIKEQKLQLLKEVEESVMGAIGSDEPVFIEPNHHLPSNDVRNGLRAKIRTQIIKSIKELGEGL